MRQTTHTRLPANVIATYLSRWCDYFATGTEQLTDTEAGYENLDVLLDEALAWALPELLALSTRCRMLADSWNETEDLIEAMLEDDSVTAPSTIH